MKPEPLTRVETRPFSLVDLKLVPEYDEDDEQANKISLLLHGRFNDFSGSKAYFGFVDQMSGDGIVSGYMHVSDDADGDSEHGSIRFGELFGADLLTVDIEGLDLTFQDLASWDNKSDAEVAAFLGAKLRKV
jgi:hypothetical protein